MSDTMNRVRALVRAQTILAQIELRSKMTQGAFFSVALTLLLVALAPLKAHAQKDAIKAEIADIEKLIEKADLLGTKSNENDKNGPWKKAKVALDPVAGKVADATTLVNSIAKIASKVNFEEELARKGMDPEAAKNLIRGLAHEIKNPLGGIRGAAQLLAAELDKDQSEYMQNLRLAADVLVQTEKELTLNLISLFLLQLNA